MKSALLLVAALASSPIASTDYAVRCDSPDGHSDTLVTDTDTETGGPTRLTEGTDGWSTTSAGTDGDSSGTDTSDAPTTGGEDPIPVQDPLDCNSDSDCPGSELCKGFGQVGVGLMYQVCADSCGDDSDCALGEKCVKGSCYTPCKLNQNNVNTCPATMVCATSDVICVYPA